MEIPKIEAIIEAAVRSAYRSGERELADALVDAGLMRYVPGPIGPWGWSAYYTICAMQKTRIAELLGSAQTTSADDVAALAEPAPANVEVMPVDVRITDALRAATQCVPGVSGFASRYHVLAQRLAQLGLVESTDGAGYQVPGDLEARLKVLRVVQVKDIDLQMPEPSMLRVTLTREQFDAFPRSTKPLRPITQEDIKAGYVFGVDLANGPNDVPVLTLMPEPAVTVTVRCRDCGLQGVEHCDACKGMRESAAEIARMAGVHPAPTTTRAAAPTHCPVCGHRTERPWAACGVCPPMTKRIPIAERVADMVDPDEDASDAAPRLPRFSETRERVTLEAVEQPDGSLRVADTAENRAKLVRAGAAIPAAPGAAGALAELLCEQAENQVQAMIERRDDLYQAMSAVVAGKVPSRAELDELLNEVAAEQPWISKLRSVAKRADGETQAPVIGEPCPSMKALHTRLSVAMDAEHLIDLGAPWLDAQDRDARMALGFSTIDRLVEAAERGEIVWSSERGWFRPACLACNDTGQVPDFDGPYDCGACKPAAEIAP
jgi:hypothetical protein